MRKTVVNLFVILSLVGCGKINEKNSDTLNVTGIKSVDNNEIINIKLKSGDVNSTSIDCYVFSSTLFEPKTSGFGYVDCDSVFNLINPLSGEVINQYQLSGFLSQTVVDTIDNVLIGQYYENDSSYVVKLDLENGTIISNNVVDFKDGIFACTYFLDPKSQEYVLLRADTTLIFINTENGIINKSIKVESVLNNAIFDNSTHRLIGVTYSQITDKNYIETLNIETGVSMSKVEIKERFDYYGCVSGFDSETNCYILVNSQNEILFIDIESGEIKDSYQLDFDIKEFKFWRSI